MADSKEPLETALGHISAALDDNTKRAVDQLFTEMAESRPRKVFFISWVEAFPLDDGGHFAQGRTVCVVEAADGRVLQSTESVIHDICTALLNLPPDIRKQLVGRFVADAASMTELDTQIDEAETDNPPSD
jgi:ABC-type phosphate/phosphonate transport system substrate-binding protein